MCPLDLSKYEDLKEESSKQQSSSTFRNIAFCNPDSHAEGKGIPLGNLFLNEGDSGDLASSVITDLGESVDYVYILDHFQYMEFTDKADDDNILFNTFQYKNPFSPIIIRDTVNKSITALPFWTKKSDDGEEEENVMNTPELSSLNRSNKYNIYCLAKLDGEWKRVKIKASASTIYGAHYDKELKKPSPHYKEPMPDSLLGFIANCDVQIKKKGFYKLAKCKLSTATVGSKNRRMTFEYVGQADDNEADLVMTQFTEFKEGVANENGSKLGHFVREMVSWGDAKNTDYILAYLQNPLLATYNEHKSIKPLLLDDVASTKKLIAIGSGSDAFSQFEEGVLIEEPKVKQKEKFVATEVDAEADLTGVPSDLKETNLKAKPFDSLENEKLRQKEVLKEVDALFGTPGESA